MNINVFKRMTPEEKNAKKVAARQAQVDVLEQDPQITAALEF